MNTFIWEGISASGRQMQGEITSLNIRLARAKLHSQAIRIVKIEQQKRGLNFKNRRISIKNIIFVLSQIATLTLAGVPLLQTIATVQQGSKSQPVKNMLLKILQHIQAGHSLASALQLYPKYFDNIICQFILIGEQTGTLDIMLQRIVQHKEKVELYKQKISKALMYPGVVISVAILVTVMLLIFIVPQFATLFADFGAALPWPTQVVINISIFWRNYWYWSLLMVMVIPGVAQIIKKCNTRTTKFFDGLVLKLPVLGSLLQRSITAKILWTLAITLKSGVPITAALQILLQTIKNKIFSAAIADIFKQVKAGQSLHSALQAVQLFPHMVIQMVAIGEEAGKLDSMLEKIAANYERDIDQAIEQMNQLLEPLVMIILGIVIGSLIIAMYLPIFKLGMVI